MLYAVLAGPVFEAVRARAGSLKLHAYVSALGAPALESAWLGVGGRVVLHDNHMTPCMDTYRQLTVFSGQARQAIDM